MSETDLEQLGRAFLETTYGTRDERFEFEVSPEFGGSPTPPRSWMNGAWGIVTAWNPGAEPGDENATRQDDLRRAVRERGWTWLEGVNGEGEHEEPSLVVRGASLKDTVELGRLYGQLAVVWGTGRRGALVWCSPLRVVRRWIRA